ncbi:MAG: hypothetical protein J2P48_18420 [Alphaproteobacteria bacterium]|nr:hypothetical protein [Alphaproteobacteria bacterium]
MAAGLHQLGDLHLLCAELRHPQYAGFILIMSGFLLRWPTPLALARFPILVLTYMRLSPLEERGAPAEFGAKGEFPMRDVPTFLPRLGDPLGGTKYRRTG